jgi:chromosome segregation ATPase
MTEIERLQERITTLEAQVALYRDQHESVSDELVRLREANDRRQNENRGWLTIYLQLLSEIEHLKADVSRLKSETEADSRDLSVLQKN